MVPDLRKITVRENKVSGWLIIIRKGHKMLAGLLARRWCNHLRILYIGRNAERKRGFNKGQDCWPSWLSIFHLSLCITQSIKADLENKETGPVPGKPGFPCVVFSRFLAEFPSGARRLTVSTYLPWLLRPTQEGAQSGVPSAIQAGTSGLPR